MIGAACATLADCGVRGVAPRVAVGADAGAGDAAAGAREDAGGRGAIDCGGWALSGEGVLA